MVLFQKIDNGIIAEYTIFSSIDKLRRLQVGSVYTLPCGV
jgi:hypothetical protein